MRRGLKSLSLTLLVAGLLLVPGTLSGSSGEDTVAADDLEHVMVCPVEGAGCVKQSCIQMCIDDGEDILECPEYCNESV